MKKCKLFLVLALAASLITGVTGDKLNTYSVSSIVDYSKDIPISVDFFSSWANYQGIQNGWYGKVLKDKFNMEVNIIAPNISGAGDNLYETRSAAGRLGDLVVLDSSKMKECVNAGLIMDITNFIKNRKNLTKYRLAIDAFKKVVCTDKIYGIRIGASLLSPLTPSFVDANPAIGSYMRLDYYRELGAPKIKNMDDMLNIIYEMQKIHPISDSGKKTYAFSLFKDWDIGYMTLASKIVSLNGYGEVSNFLFANADCSKIQVLTDDNNAYYQALKLYYKANQLGLLDPDSAFQNYDTMIDKVKDGQILFLWYPWMGGYYNTEEHKSKGLGYTYIPVEDQSIVHDGCNPYGTNMILGLGAKAKQPERLIAFLDWYASPEGLMYYSSGIDGLTYEIKNGKPVITEYGINAWTNNSPVPDKYGGGNYFDGYCHFNVEMVSKKDINPNYSEPYEPALWESTKKNRRSKLDNDWSAVFNSKDAVEYVQKKNILQIVPGVSYSYPAIPSELQNKISQCGIIIKETSWKMIFAKNEADFNKLWENMKIQLKSFGYNDVIAYDKAILEDIHNAREESIKNIN